MPLHRRQALRLQVRNRDYHEPVARLAVARLPVAGVSDARTELPFLSDLFQLRDRGRQDPRRRARRMAGPAPRLPLPSVERRRRRPGTASRGAAFLTNRLRLQAFLNKTNGNQ